MHEFISGASMMRYLIGSSRIKYTVLDELFKDVTFEHDTIDVYIDANAILYRLYRNKDHSALDSLQTELAIKDLVVNFINVIGHYRRYIVTRLHKHNRFFVLFNQEAPVYQKSLYPDFRKKRYDKYRKNNSEYSGINSFVNPSMEFIKSMLQYFEGIYMLDLHGVDEITAMKVLIDNNNIKSDYIIFSRDMLATQLLRPGTIQLYNSHDSSYIIDHKHAIQNGILKGRITQASSKMTPDFIPFIFALSGCSDINMKASKYCRGNAACVKMLNPLIEDGTLLPTMSAESFFKALGNKLEDGMELRVHPSAMINRYNAVNAKMAVSAITKSKYIAMMASVYDLFDQNMLEQMNELLSNINLNGDLIEIGNLNIDVPDFNIFDI